MAKSNQNLPGAATFAAKEEKPKPKAESSLPAVSDGGLLGSLPSIGAKPRFGGLGGVGNRAGAFDFDKTYLDNAQKELNKLNKIADYSNLEEEKKEEDTRSMLQVMQDKRKRTEASLAAA